jgi:putative ABC transport system permease protein
MIDLNANFSTGHVKIMTHAYAENANQVPNDLALLGVDTLLAELKSTFPEMDWVSRIRFGGLLDVPDENNETMGQGPAVGQTVDLRSPDSQESERMNIENSLVQGTMPHEPFEALIRDDFAERFNVSIGDEVTLFSSTMYGSITFSNFIVSGTVRFGMNMLDRGAIIIDIRDARRTLDMDNAAGEILGFFRNRVYDNSRAEQIKTEFNARFFDEDDDFTPEMFQLRDQQGLDEYLLYVENMSGIMIFFFVIALSVVLWNTGLLGGLRRYGEFGIRLALGEEKQHIYKTLIYEAAIIGLIGSVSGTILGLAASYYLQHHGINFGWSAQGGAMMLPTVYRAKVTTEAFYIGFIPGLLSMTLGNALSGLAVFKRNTARLFKELEV